MAYKLLDENGKEVNHHDLQDKSPWCKEGESIEENFISLYGQKLGLTINPEKTDNSYAPDLFDLKNKIRADLKTQNTPFFQAKLRYNLNPQFSVTFNWKDYKRYKKLYPEIDIYFWVNWIPIQFQNQNGIIKVNPMQGVWKVSFNSLMKLVESNKYPLHSYYQRVYDNKGNAKSSYVIEITDQAFKKVL
jgi:hypothetical protein